jgi:hypothetical protein
MRKVTCFVLAAALAAAPAAAQNEVAAENAVDANASTTMPVDANAMVATNDVAALPPAEPVAAEPAAAPAPERRSGGGFPWGAIGLVGLIGLLGRRRRD